jgi:hypothetical protein
MIHLLLVIRELTVLLNHGGAIRVNILHVAVAELVLRHICILVLILQKLSFLLIWRFLCSLYLFLFLSVF